MIPSGDPDDAEFWPFLISRGYRSGFRTIAAPEFLCAAGLAGLLWDVAGGAPTRADEARHRAVRGAVVGDFVVMFTVRLADGKDVGINNERPRDEHSRPVPVIEGVVERTSVFQPVGAEVLRHGAEACAHLLRQSWQADRAWQGPVATSAFRIPRMRGPVTLVWSELEARVAASEPSAEAITSGQQSGVEAMPKGVGSPEPDGSERSGCRKTGALLAAGSAAVTTALVWAIATRKR